MVEISNGEARLLIKRYITMGEAIERLKVAKNAVSDYFYASISMVGVCCYDRDSLATFQSTMQPEAAVIKIIAKEEAIQKRIDRLQVRYERFNVMSEGILKPNICCNSYNHIEMENVLELGTYAFEDTLNDNEHRLIQCIQAIEQDIRQIDTMPTHIGGYGEEEGGNILDIIDKVMEATL